VRLCLVQIHFSVEPVLEPFYTETMVADSEVTMLQEMTTAAYIANDIVIIFRGEAPGSASEKCGEVGDDIRVDDKR